MLFVHSTFSPFCLLVETNLSIPSTIFPVLPHLAVRSCISHPGPLLVSAHSENTLLHVFKFFPKGSASTPVACTGLNTSFWVGLKCQWLVLWRTSVHLCLLSRSALCLPCSLGSLLSPECPHALLFLSGLLPLNLCQIFDNYHKLFSECGSSLFPCLREPNLSSYNIADVNLFKFSCSFISLYTFHIPPSCISLSCIIFFCLWNVVRLIQVPSFTCFALISSFTFCLVCFTFSVFHQIKSIYIFLSHDFTW